MSRKKRPSPTSILIACEGTVTEFTYFERLKEEIEEEGNWAITVYPDRDKPEDQDPQTTALQLVKLAKARSEDYDEVWVVFDKDGYTLHPEAFALAKSNESGKKLNIAFSSIAFEEWVLAHFERNFKAFTKSECREGKEQLGCGYGIHARDCEGTRCICGRLRTQKYLADYGKSADYDLYPRIRHLMGRGFHNAAWLRFLHRRNAKPAHELNPYTDVDRLVMKLFGYNEEVIWAGLGEAFTLDKLQFTIEPLNGSFRVSILNLKETSIVLNQTKFGQIYESGLEERITIENRQIPPTMEDSFIFAPIERDGELPMLCLRYESKLVLFDVYSY